MMKNKYGRKTINVMASNDRDKSVFECEAYFGICSTETSREPHQAQTGKLQRQMSKLSEGKLLIDTNDPLVVQYIDENEFIRNVGGSVTANESAFIPAMHQNSASGSFLTEHNYLKK